MQNCQLNGVNGETMAEKLGLGPEVRELKLGHSFNDKGKAFHTIRYDFKPASVDVSKMATVDIGQGHQVSVTVPHLDGAGTTQTIFKGNHKPYQKECVLIFDRSTGEITLEKLSNTIQVKKTRTENKLAPPRPVTPVDGPLKKPSPRQKSSPSHLPSKSSYTTCVPRHSPLHASPNPRSPSQKTSPSYPNRSPSNQKPSPSHMTKSPTSQKSPSVAAMGAGSLPMIGLDEPVLPETRENEFGVFEEPKEPLVGVLSDSSSESNSSSDSGSSDSESEAERDNKPTVNGHVNGIISPQPSLSVPNHLLTEDLQLSESGSDTD